MFGQMLSDYYIENWMKAYLDVGFCNGNWAPASEWKIEFWLVVWQLSLLEHNEPILPPMDIICPFAQNTLHFSTRAVIIEDVILLVC